MSVSLIINHLNVPCAHQLLIAQHITEIDDVNKYKYRYEDFSFAAQEILLDNVGSSNIF